MAKKKGGKKGGVTKTVPQTPKPSSITDSINTEVIAQALSTVNQSVLLKLCRLCESKDGPFLNIFEADKVIAKKIYDLLPFGIEENDELPHKICFRCSAKVEELYEFVQKCIRTQHSLRKALGVVGPLATKTINRTLWEEKLNRSNMSNDDICNALIKKAMEGIKDIPLDNIPVEQKDKPITSKEIKNVSTVKEKETGSKKEIDSKKKEPELPTKQNKIELEKTDQKSIIKASRCSNAESLVESLSLRSKKTRQTGSQKDDSSVSERAETGFKKKATKLEESPEPEVTKEEEKPVENNDNKKPFNIMDHISMIKVNGVGVLFQCKLCNRNFLKKDIVMSHSCAKNGGPKQEAVPNYVPPPPPPKLPTVKYINTKTDNLQSKPAIINDKPIVLDDEQAPSAPTKRKPKAGPASKVKRDNSVSETEDSIPSTSIKVIPTPSKTESPTVQFPSIPSLNSQYKLVPGPNNTFTLVEEKVSDNTLYLSSDDSNSESQKTDSERKQVESKCKQNGTSTSSKKQKNNTYSAQSKFVEKRVVDLPSDKPYPVGLIKKVGHHSNDFTQSIPESIAFTTPAMKKQSYTIVQTGNPSKLLISTKPQNVSDEIPKKKMKKGRHEAKDASEQPFSVTLEDAAPPKDPGFFTFINVDPLLQPSYVLPTDNIIQESQISTSTPINSSVVIENKEKDKDSKYTCNMCGESFSREKKLLTHIHSHYNKMDEEDQLRQKAKKRARKS